MKNQNSRIFKIIGMDCPSCAMLIESELENAGLKAKVSFVKEILEIEDGRNFNETQIKPLVEKLGFKLS